MLEKLEAVATLTSWALAETDVKIGTPHSTARAIKRDIKKLGLLLEKHNIIENSKRNVLPQGNQKVASILI